MFKFNKPKYKRKWRGVDSWYLFRVTWFSEKVLAICHSREEELEVIARYESLKEEV
jgi:superfamily I DNA and/or RNA helicase